MAPRVLLIVLAGGHGSRLGPLTDGRAKPSLAVTSSLELGPHLVGAVAR